MMAYGFTSLARVYALEASVSQRFPDGVPARGVRRRMGVVAPGRQRSGLRLDSAPQQGRRSMDSNIHASSQTHSAALDETPSCVTRPSRRARHQVLAPMDRACSCGNGHGNSLDILPVHLVHVTIGHLITGMLPSDDLEHAALRAARAASSAVARGAAGSPSRARSMSRRSHAARERIPMRPSKRGFACMQDRLTAQAMRIRAPPCAHSQYGACRIRVDRGDKRSV